MRLRELGPREDFGRHGPQELHPKDWYTILVHEGRHGHHQRRAFGSLVPAERRAFCIRANGFDTGQGERIVSIGTLDGQRGGRCAHRLVLENHLAIDDLELFRAQGFETVIERACLARVFDDGR